MKKLFLLFVAAMFATLSFPACSDDDDNGGDINPAQIVGSWEITHFTVITDDREENINISQSDEAWHKIVFKADGTFTVEFVDPDNGNYFTTVEGNYSLKGDKLALEYNYEYEYEAASETGVMIVKTLNATTLVFEQAGGEEEYYKSVWTYKRM